MLRVSLMCVWCVCVCVCACADRAAVASDYYLSSFSHILSALDHEMNFMKPSRKADNLKYKRTVLFWTAAWLSIIGKLCYNSFTCWRCL